MNKHFLAIISELVSENERLVKRLEELEKQPVKIVKRVWRIPSPGPRDETPQQRVNSLCGFDTSEEAETSEPPAEASKKAEPTVSPDIQAEYAEMVVDGKCRCGHRPRRHTPMSLVGYQIHRKRVKQHLDYMSSYEPKSSWISSSNSNPSAGGVQATLSMNSSNTN